MRNYFIKIFFILLLPSILSGCATILLSTAPVGKKQTTHRFGNDVIRHVADSKTPRYRGLVLVGDKYLYHLTDTTSINNFNKLINSLDIERITIIDDIEIVKENDNDIHISQELHYSKPDNKYSDLENKFFDSLNCQSIAATEYNKGYKLCYIKLSGKLYKNTLKNNEITKSTSLKNPLIINLVTRKTSNNLNKKISALPFTLAFDAVTSPIQLLYILGNKSN